MLQTPSHRISPLSKFPAFEYEAHASTIFAMPRKILFTTSGGVSANACRPDGYMHQ